MSIELAFEILPAQGMEEIDRDIYRLLNESEEQEQLVQI